MTYDIVLYYETWFQKSNLDYLIVNKYANKSILVINGMNNKVEFNNQSYHFELSTLNGIFKSFNAIKLLKKIYCHQLVGVHFTSHNAFAYASLINYIELILIDDGIGSPAILMTKNFYWKVEYKFKFIIKVPIIMAILVFYGKILKSYSEILKRISYYYFNFINPINLPGEIIHNYNLDLQVKTISETGFIGAPLVEVGIIKKKKYIEILSRIIQIEGEIFYYPHPFEKLIYNYNISGLTIVCKKDSFEDFAQKESIPCRLIGFKSTVLLNIRKLAPHVDLFFIDFNNSKKLIAYNDILNNFKISKYTYNSNQNH